MAHTKNYYSVVLFLFIGISLFSCKKSSGTTTVEFVIVNPADGKPFQGINVKIFERNNSIKGIVSSSICEGQTDASGRIVFEFQAKRTSQYWYQPYIDEDAFGPYGSYEIIIRPEVSNPIIKNIKNTMRYEITFYAYLKKVIKNVNCEGVNDTLFIHRWSELKYGSKAYDYSIERTGCYESDTIHSIDNNPPGYTILFMGKHYFQWEVHRPSGVTYGIDSVFLERDELGRAELFY